MPYGRCFDGSVRLSGGAGVGLIVPVGAWNCGGADRAGAEAAGVMPEWLELSQNWVCGLAFVETDVVASGNESDDGLFADWSMGGWGDR
jgi:hypothetical protein